MRKPHWLFIDTAQAFGGHEVMLLRWITELRKQGHVTPVLIARAKTRLYEMTPKGVLAMPLREPTQQAEEEATHAQGWHLPLPRFIARIVNGCVNMIRLTRYVMHLWPELAIVAEGTVLAEAWVTVLLRLVGIKTVVYVPLTQSGKEMGFGRGAIRDWLVRNIYRHFPNAWITLSSEQAQHFASWSGVDRPIYVLPNTVSPEIEYAAATMNADVYSSTMSRTRNPLRVLILGRLDAHQKNLDTLLDFLSAHPQLSSDFHFTFVGDGPFGHEIEQRLHSLPALRKLISLRKWSATQQVMCEHDVLLLASRYEGVPLVMLEAMALGLPVIATDLPGTRAMLTPECLFPVGNYSHALWLLRSIKQNEWRMALIERNRDIFLTNASGAAFSGAVDVLTSRLINLISSIPDVDLQANDATVVRT